MTNNSEKRDYLKFVNTGLLTLLTTVMIFFAISVQNLHQKIDNMNVETQKEQVQRINNSNLLLDHEGRIRLLEDDMKNHVDELKGWTEDNFVKRQR